MPSLSDNAIASLIAPYVSGDPDKRDPRLQGREPFTPPDLIPRLSAYLDLLLRWNARTNLTSIRRPEEIVTRHFGESLFAARHLPPGRTLLDLGSGAGFPGVPIQLLRPELEVTLAESQGKKAAFLREVVRVLGLRTEVYANRVESMPPERRFDVVALRAVDKMDLALAEAVRRTADGLVILTSGRDGEPSFPDAASFGLTRIPIPNSDHALLAVGRRLR